MVLLMVSFAVQKLFGLMYSHSFIFAFISLAFGVKFIKSSLRSRFISLVPMFSSVYLIVLGLIFRSLIYFELLFVYGIKNGSLVTFFCMSLSSFPPGFL